MKETSNNVNETLSVLLSELKKIKDLNNLANEYKKVAQDLLIGMNNYYLSTKDVPDSFIVQMKSLNDSITNLQKEVLHAADEKVVLLTSKVEGTDRNLNSLKEQIKKMSENVDSLEHRFGDKIELVQQGMSRSNALETQLLKDVDALKIRLGNVDACMLDFGSRFEQVERIVSGAFASVEAKLRNVSENQKREIGAQFKTSVAY